MLSLVVIAGFFPFIVMYFKINNKPMWELPLWQKSKLANFLIAIPKGGYSRETWAAIRALPLLYFLVGIAYFIFYGFLLCGNIWALPAGMIVLPLVLFSAYIFDFGHDAEWHHGGFTPGFIVQEIFVSAAVLVPLVYLIIMVVSAKGGGAG